MATVSCHSNPAELRKKLRNLGLYEDGMTHTDMINILTAIKNSYASANEEQKTREVKTPKVTTGMKRKYIDVMERRLPWSLFPIPEQLSLEQRTRVLAAYKRQLNIYRYRKAKTSLTFMEWDCVFSIPISGSKRPLYNDNLPNVRQSRSGRLLKNVPQYVDDGSDSDVSNGRRKSRKKLKKSNGDEGCVVIKDIETNLEEIKLPCEPSILSENIDSDARAAERVNCDDIESNGERTSKFILENDVKRSNDITDRKIERNKTCNVSNNAKVIKNKGNNTIKEPLNTRNRSKRMKMNVEID